jgi:hypothetical protein
MVGPGKRCSSCGEYYGLHLPTCPRKVPDPPTVADFLANVRESCRYLSEDSARNAIEGLADAVELLSRRL